MQQKIFVASVTFYLINMKVELSIITGTSPDSHPCLVLTVDSDNYLIGAPEQLPRLVVKGLKITKMTNFFMTSLEPYQMGGLAPTMIQFFNNCTDYIRMTTPENINMCLFFNDRGILDVSKISFRDFEDENIKAVPIKLSKTISYDINIRDAEGAFDPKKAKELKIPAGPLFSQLKSGKTVTLEDGRIIEPQQVVGPPIKVARILFLDVQDIDKDLDLLVKEVGDLSIYTICVHLTPERILNTEKYISFFEKSGIARNICFLNRDAPIFNRSYDLYNGIRSQIPETIPPLVVSEERELNVENPKKTTFINMCQGSTYNIFPKKSAGPIQNVNEHASKEHTEYSFKPVETFALTSLGSGCKYPTNWRNTSCHLVQTPDGFVLLDCGAGSIGQMRRKFGYEGTRYILENLFCIWISHRHSDHTFGLSELLFERVKVTQKFIPLMCPELIAISVKKREPFYGDDFFKVKITPREDVFTYGVTQIRSCLVQHVEESMACEITINEKHKFVYSGDRNPIPREMEKEFGTCDVLLHEATFTDDDIEEVTKERHSTFNMAIESGKMMNAKYTLLCHISQRYELNQLVFPEPNVIVMMDYLTINYDTIERDFPLIKKASDEYTKSLPNQEDK